MDSDGHKKLERSVDRIFSFINILKITSNVSAFRKWLNEYHKINDDNKIFEGYRFFIDVCIRGFINSIIYDDSIGLDEDFTFFRARFVGVDIDDIPNTCNKIIFLKNIWKLTKNIRKSKNWEEISVSIKDIEILFSIFDVIYKQNVSPIKDLNKKDALKFATIFNTHIFLNDTSKGLPLAYLLAPILKSSAKEESLESAYTGYTYILQYLWFALLGKNKFRKSSLMKLDKAHDIYSKDAEKQIELEAGLPISEEDIKKEFMESNNKIIKYEQLTEDESASWIDVEERSDKYLKTLNDEKNRLFKPKNWFALDMFFGIIQKEIIEPIKKQTEMKSVLYGFLKIKGNINKKFVEKFLATDGLKNPEYLVKNDNKYLKKRLDCFFLWYQANVLDTQKLSVFNGVPAFTSALIGCVHKNKYFRNRDEIFILRFKHPVEGIRGFDISYGLLIEGLGGLVDYSGWLIFFDCATDYSGFGGSLYAEAEMFIKKFTDDKSLKTTEVIIDKKVFKEYLAEKSIASVFDEIKHLTPLGTYTDLSISEIKNKMNVFIGDIKGKFFEYLFFIWLIEEKQSKYEKIISDVLVNKEQIDVYAEAENRIDLFECKVNLHGDEIDLTIEQIKNKLKAVRPQKKELIPFLVVYSPITDVNKKKFEDDEEIRVISDFKEKIQNWRKLSGNSRKTIFEILNFYN